MEKPYIIKFSKIGEMDIGHLSVAENLNGIPFEIKRVYWVYGTPEHVERGNHAHKHGQQILIAVSGNIEVILENKNGETTTHILSEPSEGLFVPVMYWRKLHFSEGAVCLCLADTNYQPDDYIYDYNEFKQK